MKPAAILLMVLCLAALAGVGWLYFSADLTVEEVSCVAYAAQDQPAVFQALKDQLASGSFTGTPFDASGLSAPEDYQFLEYTLRLRNDTFLKAEVIEIQVTPMTGDILQLSDPDAHDLPARSGGAFTAAILTSREMHSIRELTLTYYLWGLPFSARVTYNP